MLSTEVEGLAEQLLDRVLVHEETLVPLSNVDCSVGLLPPRSSGAIEHQLTLLIREGCEIIKVRYTFESRCLARRPSGCGVLRGGF